MIEKKAYAKINLALDVTGKRPDGYHEVRMIMQTIGLFDELQFEDFVIGDSAIGDSVIERSAIDDSVIESSAIGDSVIEDSGMARIRLEGEAGELALDESNLIYKAAKLLLGSFPEDKGVIIRLKKHIPLAAGMAGGSTDAAATLHGINELFKIGLSDDELCELGVKIGADVPYCIKGGTMLAEGIGEKLTALPPVPAFNLVIAKPERGVSTPFVYKELDSCTELSHPDVDGMTEAISRGDREGIISRLGNILETVTIPFCPEVAEIKDKLTEAGAEGVLMSGSGPTVFAIFDSEEKAAAAAGKLVGNSCAKDIFAVKTV